MSNQPDVKRKYTYIMIFRRSGHRSFRCQSYDSLERIDAEIELMKKAKHSTGEPDYIIYQMTVLTGEIVKIRWTEKYGQK